MQKNERSAVVRIPGSEYGQDGSQVRAATLPGPRRALTQITSRVHYARRALGTKFTFAM